jgi:DNA polymerase III delta prime subunit
LGIYFDKEALDVVATWLEREATFFDFSKRYLKQVQIDRGLFNVRGLVSLGSYSLKLESVFVELKIFGSNPNKFNVDFLAAQTIEQLNNARTIWDFLKASEDDKGNGVALAIVGPPGSGKTTLLQHIAITFAANRQLQYRLPAYIPIFLFLREQAAAIAGDPTPSLDKLAHQYFSDKNRYLDLNPPEGWFRTQLKSGKCLVLLDGLDEVAQKDTRIKISEWVSQQIKRYPQCRFIITSHPQGYKTAPLERANVVEVQNFTWSQVQKFVKNWYLANAIVSNGHKVDKGVMQRAEQDSNELLERLSKPEAASLRALTVNPLLLTMLTMVHRYRGALPGSRVELYAEICIVLLGRWRQTKGVLDRLTADQKLVLLRPLAAQMMIDRVRGIKTEDAVTIIDPLLGGLGIGEQDPQTILKELESGSGLLLESEKNYWSFAHLTFQEYLTATAWQENRTFPLALPRLVNDSWWHETLKLYCAKSNATPILQACLEENSVQALTLAIEILDEGPREASEEVCEEVNLRVGLDSDDLERFHLAAGVYLNRHLKKSFQPLSEQTELDKDFIVCAEFQLFIDEMQQLPQLRSKYYQPVHWNNERFPQGQAKTPALGMTGNAAKAFCQWLTDKRNQEIQTSQKVKYRLPNKEEIEEIKTSSNEANQDNGNVLWYCDGEKLQLALSDEQVKLLEEKIVEVLGRELALFYQEQGLNLAFAFHKYPARVLDLDLARDLALVLDRDLDRDLIHALDRARDLARDLDRDLDRVLDRALDHARDLILDCALDLTLDLDLDLALARARDRALVLALARALDLDRALDRASDRARARDRDRDLTLALALALDRDRARDFKEFIDLIVKIFDDLFFIEILYYLTVDLDCLRKDQLNWTASVSTRDWLIAIKPSLVKWQAANEDREVLPLTKLLIQLSGEINVNDKGQNSVEVAQENCTVLLVLLDYFQKNSLDDLKEKEQQEWQDALKVFYIHIKLLDAYLKGQLPAWEGIRLVRETCAK